MQIALDIPESLYEKLKVVAESDGVSVAEVLVRQADFVVMPTEQADPPLITFDGPRGFPRIHSKQPGTLNIGPEGLNEYLFLP